MATFARYFDLVREMKDAYNHRLRLVESAKQRGIKPTARLFVTTVLTVRKWLRRFQQHGPSGLVALPRARHQQSQKTPPTTEAQLVELRKTLPTFGARRLIREFDLPISHGALERIWREHGLLKERRRKYQRKQDLAHIKASWALFQQISADTKDLDDIPRYWLQAQRLHLPTIQYTARDVRSGLLFWAFAQQRSASASAVFASRIQQHLDRYGVSLRDLVWQTDNGGEFKGDFPKALGDSQHVRIPPAAHTYQSDVETVHRLEEDEFFDLENFASRGDFLAKVHTYQLYFNLVRPNSHKENQSPWQIIERLAPRSPLQLCLLPPVFLDYHLNDLGGYHVPRLPCLCDGPVEQTHDSGRRRWLAVRPLAGFADDCVLFVQILAIRTGPHAVRFCVAAAKKEARAKSENSNPGNRRNEEPELRVLFNPLGICPEAYSHESDEEGHKKIAGHGKGSPKPGSASAAAGEAGDPRSGCNEKRNFEHTCLQMTAR